MCSRCDWCCGYFTVPRIKRWLKRPLIGLAGASVLAAVVILVLRFAVVPEVEARIADVRLDVFGFSAATANSNNNSSFVYNMSVALAVRNPNRAMKVTYTEPLVAALVFYDRRLSSVTVAGEGHVHPARRRELHLLHAGGEVPSYVLAGDAAGEFEKQKEAGVFQGEVRLSGRLTLGLGNKRRLHLSCPLSGLHLAPPGPEVLVFPEVTCTPNNPDKIYF